MNTHQKLIAGFIAVSAAFFGLAQARGPGDCDGQGPMRGAMMRDGQMGQMGPMMAQRGEQRLERLHADLKINAQQEPLWQAFADKTKAEMGKGMQAMRSSPADAKLSAPERMEKMQAMMKERLAAMEGVNDSFKRLYAGLSDEQKAAADMHFNRMGMRGRNGMGRMGPGSMPRNPDATKG